MSLGCSCFHARSCCVAGDVRRHEGLAKPFEYVSLTAIPRFRAGLRGGAPGSSPGQAPTGRRPLGLASLVARLFLVPCGIVPRCWCYTARYPMCLRQPRHSGAASATARRPVRPPPRRPALQRGIAVSEKNLIPKPRHHPALSHQPRPQSGELLENLTDRSQQPN